jgi:hypothetical protein
VEGSGTDGIQVFPACSTGYDVSTGCPDTVPNDYNVIRGNEVDHNGFGEPLAGALGDGIALLAMGPPVVAIPRHNVVEGNSTDGNQRNGISLGGGNGQEINKAPWTTGGENYGCFISPDPDNPVVDTPNLCGVTDNTIVHNSSSANGITGIYIGPRSDDNTVSYNATHRNGKDGIGIGLAVRYGPGQLPVLDPNGQLVTIPGSGARNNLLEHNTGAGDKRWDGADENPGCGSNRWVHSRFRTVNQSCVGGSRARHGSKAKQGAKGRRCRRHRGRHHGARCRGADGHGQVRAAAGAARHRRWPSERAMYLRAAAG